MHSEAVQYWNVGGVGAENGFLQGYARRLVTCAHKTLEVTEGFQQSIFTGQVRGVRGWLLQTCVVLESFVLLSVQGGQVRMFF